MTELAKAAKAFKPSDSVTDTTRKLYTKYINKLLRNIDHYYDNPMEYVEETEGIGTISTKKNQITQLNIFKQIIEMAGMPVPMEIEDAMNNLSKEIYKLDSVYTRPIDPDEPSISDVLSRLRGTDNDSKISAMLLILIETGMRPSDPAGARIVKLDYRPDETKLRSYKDGMTNYLVIGKEDGRPTLNFVLNRYKTKREYGQMLYTLSNEAAHRAMSAFKNDSYVLGRSGKRKNEPPNILTSYNKALTGFKDLMENKHVTLKILRRGNVIQGFDKEFVDYLFKRLNEKSKESNVGGRGINNLTVEDIDPKYRKQFIDVKAAAHSRGHSLFTAIQSYLPGGLAPTVK